MTEEKILMISLTWGIFSGGWSPVWGLELLDNPFLSFRLFTLKSSLSRRSVVFTFTSVSFGASLEDNIAGIVGKLGIFVNAVNVDAIIVLNHRMLH